MRTNKFLKKKEILYLYRITFVLFGSQTKDAIDSGENDHEMTVSGLSLIYGVKRTGIRGKEMLRRSSFRTKYSA